MGCYIKKFGINEHILLAGQVANQSMLNEGYEWYDGEIPDLSNSLYLKWDGETVYEDTEERIASELIRVRRIRDEALEACDWVITKCTELGIGVPQNWKDYRQSLRDITNGYTAGQDQEMVWPTPPSSQF